MAKRRVQIDGSDDVSALTQRYAQSVQKLLCQRGQTLCVAESLTGGGLSRALTEQKGASRFFSGSVVAYSYQVKTEQLAVSSLLLKKKGAVCEEVAQQMARGVKKTLGGIWGLSVTGVAGPSLMPKDPPVGTVFIALATHKKIADPSLKKKGFFKEKTRCLSNKDLVFFVKKLQMLKHPLIQKKNTTSQTGENRVKTQKTALPSEREGDFQNNISSLFSEDFMRQSVREQTVLYALKFLDQVLKLCERKKN